MFVHKADEWWKKKELRRECLNNKSTIENVKSRY